jgi:hypothetical protein
MEDLSLPLFFYFYDRAGTSPQARSKRWREEKKYYEEKPEGNRWEDNILMDLKY